MTTVREKKNLEQVARYADMFSAMGTEARLRIMQLLLSAHPEGMVVTEIQEELDIPNSTLSHHLDKLKNEDLVRVQRESTFLRYTANTAALQQILTFLYSECCTRNKAIEPQRMGVERTGHEATLRASSCGTIRARERPVALMLARGRVAAGADQRRDA